MTHVAVAGGQAVDLKGRSRSSPAATAASARHARVWRARARAWLIAARDEAKSKDAVKELEALGPAPGRRHRRDGQAASGA